MGKQDVSFVIEGMGVKSYRSKTLEDCGTDPVFRETFAFPCRGTTHASFKVKISLWKEDGVREPLGDADVALHAFRRAWTAQQHSAPVSEGGQLLLEVRCQDPQHEAEVAAQQLERLRLDSEAKQAAEAAAEAERQRLASEAAGAYSSLI